ncbi:receptor-type tyrosine-protein phosphatase N2 isoform X2 [Takifugu rubripes]|uniref:Protein tyrosine phosphatase receptor type N2 n=1 Tax=Takifugu rubripes TaxID=31033 RepID=H2TIX0_TAKRU|nr:receptor-type tyrosine-protein phosphatase N2 isoform X2 [Takifugu rubripes]
MAAYRGAVRREMSAISSHKTDGVFGRCQELAGADLHTYQLSSSALQRLRILLQKLARKGLTWQDDVTQQAISRELAKLRNTPLHRQAVPPGPRAAFGSSTDRKLRPSQAELHGNLQQYLNSLGLFSHPDVGGQSGVQRQEASVQNDDFKSDPPFESGWSKPKPGWKETTLYSLHRGDGNPPLTKVITKTGEGRHPSLSSKDPGRNELPSKQLERLLAPGAKEAWPTGKLRYLNYIHPVGHSESQLDFGSSPQRPNPDKVLFQTSPNRHASKEPLGISDDHFIQNVVNQLGPHSIHMDSLMGNNLEQLAQVIAEVMQEEQPNVETQPAPAIPARGKEGGGNQDQDLKSNRVQDLIQEDSERMKQKGQQTDSVDKDPVDKHKVFFSKLLDYLNMEPFDNPPKAQKMVGMENVHSQTKQGQVPILQEKVDAPQIGGPDGQVDSEIQRWMQGKPEEPKKSDLKVKTQLVHIGVKEFSSRGKGRHFGYIITGSESLTAAQASELMERLTQRLNLHAADLTQLSVLGPALTFRLGPNPKNLTTADLVQVAVQQKLPLEKETGLKIVEAGVSDGGSLTQIPVVKETRVESGQFLLLSVLCMLFILVVLAASTTFFCVRQRSHLRMKEKLASLGTDTSTDATATYQELCRQRMASRTSERVERPETLRHSRLNSVSSQFSDGPAASPSTRSSTSSWCEEPVPSNMDISTGHMILSYMEDHLKNKNRLEREWEALCSYQAEPSACGVGHGEQNSKRNRSEAVVAYDHSRITLKAENNHGNSDYINASPIMDHDPRNPTYISSQGPLPTTVADFWQMVWESGCVVVVMLTPLSENGVKQCHRYWPDEGSDIYHIYEVNLVSEHIWCEDFLVRSFYLKNLQTNETRTVTQFHFLSWMDRGIPNSARTLLDFRRKVNKCYRGRSCPIIVHCSDGAGRSGTYVLIDMVLNRLAKGAKEIDIAATLEHLRDQRAGMVQTKEQFEFALTAVAEEVNAILKALPQ